MSTRVTFSTIPRDSADIFRDASFWIDHSIPPADHVLTIRTLVDKYLHNHNEKIYACFVDFKKAFDSISHVGLLYKLLQINVGGCFYNLINSLYSNSTCSIKLEQNQTRPFQYAKVAF